MRRTTIAALTVAAVTVVPVATAAATSPSSSHQSKQGSSHSRSLNEQDKEYLKDAAQGALWEIRGGKIAQTHAAHSYTKAFGQRMITDHGKEYRDAQHTAAEVGVAAPHSPDETQQHDLMLLGQFKGASFDCAYLSTEWADHMADVNGAKLELASGRNEEVKELAAKYLPILEAHLSMAEQDLMKLTSCGSSMTHS